MKMRMKRKGNRVISLLLVFMMVLSTALQVPIEAKAAQANDFTGKVISIMGDSISTYEGWIPEADGFNLEHLARYPDSNNDLTIEVEETWWHSLIIGKLGAKIGINDSWRGSEVGNDGTQDIGKSMASKIRITNLGSNGTPDVILFYGGTNDLGHSNDSGRSIEIGDFSTLQNRPSVSKVDWETEKWDTVVEAYATALVRMKSMYPNAKILAMFPTVTSTYYNGAKATLNDFNEELKEICEYYGVSYVDLYEESGVVTSDLPDGIHPGKEGMEKIKNAVYKKLTEDSSFYMTSGKHDVYSITHNLTSVKATKGYYKGVDAGEEFEETLSPHITENMQVTVKMGDDDITESCYDKQTGQIRIQKVTGNIEVQATDPSGLSCNVQTLPPGADSSTNLWDVLEPEDTYYDGSKWGGTTAPSITIPVQPGYKIAATSFKKAGENGSDTYNGIRVTYFKADGKALSIGLSKDKVYDGYGYESVYDEYTKNNGYIVVPDDVVAVNIPMWEDTNPKEVRILNLPDLPENPVMLDKSATLEDNGTYTIDLSAFTTGQTTTQQITSYVPLDVVLVLDASSSMLMYDDTTVVDEVKSLDGKKTILVQGIPGDVTADTNLWNVCKVESGYFIKDGNWAATVNGNTGTAAITSITIPVGKGDFISARSFMEAESNGSGIDGIDGIRITYFDTNGNILKDNGQLSPSQVIQKYKENNGYLIVPEGAAAVNIPMWTEDGKNWVYLTDNSPTTLKDQYNPKTEGDLSNMRVAILQKQVEDFAEQLYNHAATYGVDHRMSIVTFGGGDDDPKPSGQGYYDKHVSVNGLTSSHMYQVSNNEKSEYHMPDGVKITENSQYTQYYHGEGFEGDYYFTNTGLFVDGTFKNYNNSLAPKTDAAYLYTPVFKADLDTSKTYYYLTYVEPLVTKINNIQTRSYGDILPVTYQDGQWKEPKGAVVIPMESPYDSTSHRQFLERTADEVVVSPLTVDDYKAALMPVAGNGGMNPDLKYATDRIVARGGTDTKFGLEMAYNVLDANENRTVIDAAGNEIKSKQIVILFTDGETDNTEDGTYDTIYQHANAIKEFGAELYMVAVEEGNKARDWMVKASSGEEYCMFVENMREVSSFFEKVTNDQVLSNPVVTLDSKTVMRDILGNGFVLPENFQVQNESDENIGIDVMIQEVTATDADTYTYGDKKYVYEPSDTLESDGSIKYYCTEDDAPVQGIEVSFDKETGVIDVTGFDYSDNYVALGHPGYRMVVSIKGVEATESAVTDGPIPTNKAGSGLVYKDSDDKELIYGFTSPMTELVSKLYVMDYAKPMQSVVPNEKQTSISHVATDMKKIKDLETASTGEFGRLEQNQDKTTFTFTPTTTVWDESADFYLFGQWASGKKDARVTTALAEDEQDYLWSKVSIVPANSIYFEDDFVTDESTGTVGIEYSGDWKVDYSLNDQEGTGENTSDDVSNRVHGWQDALADDTGYTDGSAHVGEAKATATFRFKGTGVDVYARTNSSAGSAAARLYAVREDGTRETKAMKTLIVDQLSKSGDYYQIPTLFFKDLPYGEYEVFIQVGRGVDKNEDGSYSYRKIYYLDGIRVYNPLGENDDQYAEKEQDAVFTGVREILLDNGSFNAENLSQSGAVFIDEVPKTDEAEVIAEVTEPEGTTESEETAEPEQEGQEGNVPETVSLETSDNVGVTVSDGETNYGMGTYEDYGPKNEVYLSNGQAVVLKVDTDGTYYLGLKSPTGEDVKAEVSYGEDKQQILISHTSDLYYEVKPDNNGYIVIQNTADTSTAEAGEGTETNRVLLSITKLRTTMLGEENGVVDITPEEAVARVFALRRMPVYEEPADNEEETEVPEENPGEVEVEIENPDFNGNENWYEILLSLVENMFGSVRRWLKATRF